MTRYQILQNRRVAHTGGIWMYKICADHISISCSQSWCSQKKIFSHLFYIQFSEYFNTANRNKTTKPISQWLLPTGTAIKKEITTTTLTKPTSRSNVHSFCSKFSKVGVSVFPVNSGLDDSSRIRFCYCRCVKIVK